jgi:hypothetical protein
LPFLEKWLKETEGRDSHSLGLPSYLAICSKLGSRIIGGHGLIFVSEMGDGKGYICRLTQRLFPDLFNTMKTVRINPPTFIKQIKEAGWENTDIELINEDLSHVISETYHIDDTMGCLSGLISDREYAMSLEQLWRYSVDQKDKNAYNIMVKSLSVITCCTNLTLERIRWRPPYDGMWRDRFDEYIIIVTPQQYEWISDNRNFATTGEEIIKAEHVRDRILSSGLIPTLKTLPQHPFRFTKEAHLHFNRDKATGKPGLCDILYETQHTENRGSTYLKGMLTASALLNGRDIVTESDVAVFRLFYPNMNLAQFRPGMQRLAQNCLRWKKETLLKKIRVNAEDARKVVSKCIYENGKNECPIWNTRYRIILKSHYRLMLMEQEAFINAMVTGTTFSDSYRDVEQYWGERFG